MPWEAKGNKILRKGTGKVVGRAKSHAAAKASVKARYANYTPNANAKDKSGFGYHGVTASRKKTKS